MDDPTAILRAKLNLETARVPWRELQRFFAAGRALYVAPELSLVDVAFALAADAAAEVEALMNAGALGPVADDTARDWYERDVAPWCVVVKPWVLVQERPGEE